MNKNIKNAMKKALEEVKISENQNIPEDFVNKFVEFLLKDCDQLCMADYKNQGCYGAGYRLSKEMQKHFGVLLLQQ